MNAVVAISLYAVLLLDAVTALPRPQLAESTALRVPLVRRSNTKTPEALFRKAEHLKQKYGAAASNSARAKRQSSATLSVTDFEDSEFYAPISVGTPSSTFSVVLDTGSSDLVLATAPCSGCNSGTPLYNPSDSSTSVSSDTNFSITYGSGAASGVLVQDTVSIAGFSVSRQAFGACDVLQDLVDGSISGLLGLGWKGLSSSGSTPLLEALAENGAFTSQVFSFAFDTSSASESETSPGGTMTIGAVDTSLYSGEINWVSALSPLTYWLIPLDDVLAGGSSLGISSNATAIDTGTTLIGVPTTTAEAIYSAIGGTAVQLQGQSGYYEYPCSSSPNVTLTFGGVEYPISSELFNAGQADQGGTQCYGAIFAMDDASVPYIVGDAFLQGYYSAFRFSPDPAVGFATLGSGGVASSNTSTTDKNGSSSTSSSPAASSAASSVSTSNGLISSSSHGVLIALGGVAVLFSFYCNPL